MSKTLWAGCVETYTGKRYELAAPKCSQIDPLDIAHALALQCRYNGHCRQFYSVAEHSVHVADLVADYLAAELAAERLPVADPDRYLANAKLAALLHDASEAYLGDVVRPVKTKLKDYGPLEILAQTAILKRFHVDYGRDVRELVEAADNWALLEEARQLLPSRGEHWGIRTDKRYLFPKLTVEGWLPALAREMWLHTYWAAVKDNPMLNME